MKQPLRLSVNQEPVEIWIESHRTLLDVLRNELGLTGTKHGCELGDCGACTVLQDGEPVLSCIQFALHAQDRQIETIEGLHQDPIQTAFDRHVAAQCGYCTPGIVLTLLALRKSGEAITPQSLDKALGSNICRCTGYTKIKMAAIEALGNQINEP
ncbi:MAG: (2Fe-2S)-binding protein [Myxococcota bacterium]